MGKLRVLYKCSCMHEEAGVSVPVRRVDEDLMDWVDKLRQYITVDHQNRSPPCIKTSMEYVKLPVPENAPFLGAEGKLDS